MKNKDAIDFCFGFWTQILHVHLRCLSPLWHLSGILGKGAYGRVALVEDPSGAPERGVAPCIAQTARDKLQKLL